MRIPMMKSFRCRSITSKRTNIITRKDRRMARLIAKTGEFQFQLDQCDSVYESLLEAIAYQSISGKAAATIFARIKALGSNGLCPTPAGNTRRVRIRRSAKPGLSGAKAAAIKDLAQKTIEGVVPRSKPPDKCRTKKWWSAWFPCAASARGLWKCF